MRSPTVPLVTVVIPCRNEAAYISRSLGAVLAQTYPPDRMEVIVADGMSDDGTREIIAAFRARHPNVRMIDNAGRIVPTGLNAALAEARGEVIARVDGHCEVEADYISRCVEYLSGGVAGVGGALETVGETPTARVIAAAMSSPFGVGGSAFRTTRGKTIFTDTVAFPAYTRAAVERAGPFDEELVRNQDDEYNYRLRKMGAKILLAGDVRTRYYSRSSIRSLWKQYFQYGYWKVRVMQKHWRQMSARQFVPPLFVATLAATLLMAPFSMTASWALAALSFSYLTACAAATLRLRRDTPARLLPLYPVVFATIHFAFGIGFLAGLVRFRGRWGEGDGRRTPRPAFSRGAGES